MFQGTGPWLVCSGALLLSKREMEEKTKPAEKEAPLSLVSIKLSWMCEGKEGR